MIIKSISVENNYGKNTSRVIIYCQNTNEEEKFSVIQRGFMQETKGKETLFMKIDKPISKQYCLPYVQFLLKDISTTRENEKQKKSQVTFSYIQGFYVSWKDKNDPTNTQIFKDFGQNNLNKYI